MSNRTNKTNRLLFLIFLSLVVLRAKIQQFHKIQMGKKMYICRQIRRIMKIKHFRISIVLVLFAFSFGQLKAQSALRVFFIGNSYTYFNNLPALVANIAQSMGDEMTCAGNTPGGCTLEMHSSNASMETICRGGWDFVVMQEQSHLPAFPIEQVEEMVFPFAERLADSVYAFNPDAEPMFFMTWGRKNGDTEFGPLYPLMSTYEGMDSLLYERYMYMGAANNASVCPVGRVWHHLRDHHSEIELYQPDGSHPSLAGSYAAACAFYTMLFHRDPDSIAYDAGLSPGTAQLIRSAVHFVVFDSLWKWQSPSANVTPEEKQQPVVSVCPNPAIGEVTLRLPDGLKAEILLFGTDGKTLWRKKIQGSETTFSMHGLPTNIYLLKVITPRGVTVKRIVKL